MNEQHNDDTLKLTDLDFLTGNHHLQMMKAALPYMNLSQQKMFSVFIKAQEMRRTMNLFQQGELSAMGLSTQAKQTATPADMLEAIKPYANTYEQELISLMSSLIKGTATPMDQLKNLLTPEQQSRIDTMQFMMQAMQQMNGAGI